MIVSCIILQHAGPAVLHDQLWLTKSYQESAASSRFDGDGSSLLQNRREACERWICELRLGQPLTLQRVDCPDLLGHGWAPHHAPYNIQTLAQHLADNLNESYEVVGGVSFGSTIAAALYPLLQTKPKRLVLAEPLLDHPAFEQDKIDGAVNGTKDIPTEESILQANPSWIAAEATLRRMSLTQIDPEAIRQLFGVSHLSD